MMYGKKISLLLVAFVYSLTGFSQAGADVTINNRFPLTDSFAHCHINSITVTGNKKTKGYIVLREAQVKMGDSLTLQALPAVLDQARKNIYNTTLFNEVRITANFTDESHADINVDVKERWYIFPTPQFQPVDRNFNEWIKTYKADLQRVNYGIKFVHYNLSGRRDQLRIYLLNGYTRNISFSYSAPYSNSALTEGFSVSGGYSQNREITYKTSSDNKTLLFKKGDFARSNINLNASYSIRRAVFTRTTLFVAY